MLFRKLLFVAFIVLSNLVCLSQDKYFTKTGKIDIHSNAALEDIEGRNKTVSVLLDAKAGTLIFSVLQKGFEFEKALMQEHFNSDYVESDKYPRSEFKGVIINNHDINYGLNGTYPAKVKGELTLHGITKHIETTGSISIDNNSVITNASFNIALSDFNIKIPAVVKDKVAKTINIKVDCKLEPYK